MLLAGISAEPEFVHLSGRHCVLPEPEQDRLDEVAAASAPILIEETDEAAAVSGSAPVPTASDSAVPKASVEEDTVIGGIRLPKSRAIGSGTSVAASPANSVASVPKPKRFRTPLKPKHRIQVMASPDTDEPFHPAQAHAVQTTEGPLLILAGAGSGKTRVMTARTAHLIQELGVSPRSIMVVTFTTKAAEEMRHRLSQKLTPQEAGSLISGTFHGLFYRMLLHHDSARWDQRRLLSYEWQKRKFVRESGIGNQLEPPLFKESEMESALGIISKWKNEYILPHQAALLQAASPEESQAQELYPLYEEAKRRSGYFDFDDMLIGCLEMLRENPNVLQLYQNRLQYLMIDEFQDINRVQYEIVKLLAAPQNNLCVIGDDDQSIYGFRGSNPQYILGFTTDFPEAQRITLEVNYRSKSSIVSLGYSLIGNNRTRWKKEFQSFHMDEGECYLFQPVDEEEQASSIVDEIRLRLARGAAPEEFAILFRTYESTRPIVERLTDAGIPFAFTREDEPFYKKQVVRWALSYLKLAIDRDNEEALREILQTLYLPQQQWNEIRSLTILENACQLDVLSKLTSLKSFQRVQLQKVTETLLQIPALPPAHALEIIYEELKLRDYVKKRNKDRSEGDTDRATDELRQLLVAAKRHDSIPAFLQYIDEMLRKEAESRKQSQSTRHAVQMMSIHRAKGLEFDTVFLVDVVEGALPHEHAIEQKRQGSSEALEEERRLMYVAITRARHHLFVGVPQERFGRKTRMSRFVGEMGRGD